MNFELKPMGKTQRNCFIVDVEYLHANGCIDFKTKSTYVLNKIELTDLEKYITLFNQVSSALNRSSSDGKPLDKNIESLLKYRLVFGEYQYVLNVPETKLEIIVKTDLTDDGEDQYIHFAEMAIVKIMYINEDRDQFIVNFKE